MDFGQIGALLVSALLGTASIYSMMQNALMVAVGFMILLYLFGILFNRYSRESKETTTKEAEYILVEE